MYELFEYQQHKEGMVSDPLFLVGLYKITTISLTIENEQLVKAVVDEQLKKRFMCRHTPNASSKTNTPPIAVKKELAIAYHKSNLETNWKLCGS